MTEEERTLLTKIGSDHTALKLYHRHRELDQAVDKLARQSSLTPLQRAELGRLKVRKARVKQQLFQMVNM